MNQQNSVLFLTKEAPDEEARLNPLTDPIFETGASGILSKSQKSLICGGVRQAITLKSPSKGTPTSNPSRGLQYFRCST